MLTKNIHTWTIFLLRASREHKNMMAHFTAFRQPVSAELGDTITCRYLSSFWNSAATVRGQLLESFHNDSFINYMRRRGLLQSCAVDWLLCLVHTHLTLNTGRNQGRWLSSLGDYLSHPRSQKWLKYYDCSVNETHRFNSHWICKG